MTSKVKRKATNSQTRLDAFSAITQVIPWM